MKLEFISNFKLNILLDYEKKMLVDKYHFQLNMYRILHLYHEKKIFYLKKYFVYNFLYVSNKFYTNVN